jgi:hypothetical protein
MGYREIARAAKGIHLKGDRQYEIQKKEPNLA